MIGNINTHHFQEVYIQKQEDDLRSESREKSVHSHMQPALGLDVSLHGGIPPGRPPDWRKAKVFSQLWESYTYLAKEGALGEASTTKRNGFKREKKFSEMDIAISHSAIFPKKGGFRNL